MAHHDTPEAMKSTKPYLLRAMHEWIVDSGKTPHLLAKAGVEGIDVPEQAIVDGQLVLNLSPSAVRDLLMDAEGVSFVARFGGVSRSVYLTLMAVEGIYARENGRGMMFAEEAMVADASESQTGQSEDAQSGKKPVPSLRVIK